MIAEKPGKKVDRTVVESKLRFLIWIKSPDSKTRIRNQAPSAPSSSRPGSCQSPSLVQSRTVPAPNRNYVINITSYLEELAPGVTLGVAQARADASSEGWCLLNKKVASASQRECEKWDGRFFADRRKAEQAFEAEKSKKSVETPMKRRFFKPWFGKKN
jgi:hypothetical protein